MKFSPLLLIALLSSGCAVTLEEALAKRTHFEADYVETAGSERQAAFDELRTRIEGWGFTVADIPADSDFAGWGQYYKREKLILLKGGLDPNASFEVLAHEAGHIFQPPFWSADAGNKGKAEVFAELVAQGIAKHYGYEEYVEVSQTYLLAYKDSAYIERVMKEDIKVAVECLTGQRPAPNFDW